MGHIFISYSHKDKTYAHKLQRNLLEQGFEAWIDDRIDYGTLWPSEIEKRLRDCDAFILIMSPAAYESEWVQNELNLARKLKKPIFPLLLDGEEWWLVGTTQFVDVKGGKLPDTKFFVRLAEVSSRKWSDGRGSGDPRSTQSGASQAETPPAQPSQKVSIHVNGNVQGNIILGDGNQVQSAARSAEKTAREKAEPDVPKKADPENVEKQVLPTSIPIKTPEKPPRLKTEYMIAIIGAAATIIAGLLSSPLIERWFSSVSTPTATVVYASLIPTETTVAALPTTIATTEILTPSATGAPTLTPTVEFTLTAEFTPTVAPWPAEITEKGAKMALVPAGTFMMGSESGRDDEKPAHTVTLDAFYMDVYEVTNALYKACVDAGACKAPSGSSSYTRSSYYSNSQYDNYPVIYVDWNQADAYCEWRGARLPIEAEWEYAALGSDQRIYPWGNEFDDTKANFCDRNCPFGYADKNYDDGYADTAPVDSYPTGKSPFGLYNMAGNVWEWVADWYDAYPGNTLGNSDYGEKYRVVRGGSWNYFESFLRVSFRFREAPGYKSFTLGLRCARDP